MDHHWYTDEYVKHPFSARATSEFISIANLMGLQFGGASEVQYPDDELQYPEDDPFDMLQEYKEMFRAVELGTPSRRSSKDSTPSPIFPQQLLPAVSFASTAHVTYEASMPTYARVWTKEDRGDLVKLGKMVSSFLNVSRFAVEDKLFETRIINSLMDEAGPKPGSIQVLTQVMESAMIRHRYVSFDHDEPQSEGEHIYRIEDIEKEIVLPTLHQETVLLDMDPLGVKTYNVLQAIVAINAVTSERVGAVC